MSTTGTPKPIRQLSTGSNVYFETEKYRLNDLGYSNTKKYVLNIYNREGMLAPIKNLESDNLSELYKIAETCNRIYPNGVPDAILIDKLIENIKNGKYDDQEQPDTKLGHYYVSVRNTRGDNYARALGPFVNDHAAALAAVDKVQRILEDLNVKGFNHWTPVGTMRVDADKDTPPSEVMEAVRKKFNELYPHIAVRDYVRPFKKGDSVMYKEDPKKEEYIIEEVFNHKGLSYRISDPRQLVSSPNLHKKSVKKPLTRFAQPWQLTEYVKTPDTITCPPMENGKPSISPAGIAKLKTCISDAGDTANLHKDANGNFTPQREAFFQKLINEFKEQKPCIVSDKPIAVLTGGAPGSGKSHFLKGFAPWINGNKVYHIDADEVRAKLPEYKGWNADNTHTETSHIVNMMLDSIGTPCKHDLVYDGTMNKAKKYLPLVKRLKAMGYDVLVIYMQVPKDVSMHRVMERYQRTGRYVPQHVIDEVYANGLEAYEEVIKAADGYIRVDGVTGKILEKGGMPIPKERDYEAMHSECDTCGNETNQYSPTKYFNLSVPKTIADLQKGVEHIAASYSDRKMAANVAMDYLNEHKEIGKTYLKSKSIQDRKAFGKYMSNLQTRVRKPILEERKRESKRISREMAAQSVDKIEAMALAANEDMEKEIAAYDIKAKKLKLASAYAYAAAARVRILTLMQNDFTNAK